MYYFVIMLFFCTIPYCSGMNEKSEEHKELRTLLAYYTNKNFDAAKKMLDCYDKEKNPFLLDIISEDTNNTILHELALLITKKTFKEFLCAFHTIITYHPTLITEENGQSYYGFLPAHLITEDLTEHEWNIFWAVAYNPERHTKTESYFLEKMIKTKPIPIKKPEKEKKVKKTSSFKLFSFTNSRGTSRSNSLITLPLLKEYKN